MKKSREEEDQHRQTKHLRWTSDRTNQGASNTMYNTTDQIESHRLSLSDADANRVATLADRGEITARATASGKRKRRNEAGLVLRARQDDDMPLVSNWLSDDNAPSSNNEEEGDDEEVPVLFPTKLFAMLQDAETERFTSVVSWGESGDTFRVHKKLEFEKVVLPKYFKMTKYKSFTRQLHNYCFNWVNKGPERGGYYNPNFTRRSDPNKCHLLEKKPRKNYRRKRVDLEQHVDEESKAPPALGGEGSFFDEIPVPSNVLLQSSPTSQNSQTFPTLPLESLEPRTIEEMLSAPQMPGLSSGMLQLPPSPSWFPNPEQY